MKRCKIEVIKTYFDDELAQEFGVTCACPAHKVGDTFIAEGFAKPEGFCDEAWKAIYQYVFALAHMDKDSLFYGDWIQTPGVSINSCNDGIRPVIFKITRLDEDVSQDALYTPQDI
ncbi:MAG: TIGR04076 family protein [Desulfovibrionaceae bacterium]|nr:TIGR04076 family protein [Desulfovibrionaceae bacterium]